MAHSDPRIARLFQNSVHMWFHHEMCMQQGQVMEYRDNESDRDTGETKAQRRKYKRLRDWSAVRLATVRVTQPSLTATAE
jgi:hypothetical protein